MPSRYTEESLWEDAKVLFYIFLFLLFVTW